MPPPPSAPSDPPSAPVSAPDALDLHEAQLHALLLTGRREALDAFIAGLPSELAAPPEAEPEAGRRSTAELVALARAGTGAPHGCPAGALRAGYVVDGSSGTGSARVVAALAEALAEGASPETLRERFPDLWAVDLALWNAPGASPNALARMWLESPGRRLLQDLRALRKLPSESRIGATLGTLARIHRAAGVDGAPAPADVTAFEHWKATRPAPWLELHLTAPGRAMLSWAPRDGSPVSALQALELIEEASPLSLRGSALAWCWRRMSERPRYDVGGISRDLRDELPARLAGALEDRRASSARAPADLEEVTLAHAVRINAEDSGPGAVFRTWGVARWLASCLWRSPFFGGDEPTLVERLRALLPATETPPRADALDPARFDRGRGLDVEEVALIGGALALEARGAQGLVIPPGPLVRAVKKIAGRADLRAGEEQAEELLAHGASEMGWPAPHVAPPLAARWWLTERQVRWLGEIPEAGQQHVLTLLSRAPERFGWSCFAVMEEGDTLSPAARETAANLWRRWRAGDAGPSLHEQCAFGIGLLSLLDDAEATDLLEVAQNAEGTWPPFLMDAIARAAEHAVRSAVWRAALERLLDLAAHGELDVELRLNAALFAALRTSSKKLRADDLASRLSRLAAEAPFTRHLGLQRELRRRGALPPATAAGGGR